MFGAGEFSLPAAFGGGEAHGESSCPAPAGAGDAHGEFDLRRKYAVYSEGVLGSLWCV